jgi:hypothetical protein
MKCHEFETGIDNLLQAERGGSAPDSNAIAHAAECEHCAALLESERQLSADLHALAAMQSNAGASEATGQKLLAAFRAQHQQQTQAKPAWAWNWRWGAAAATLALFALGIYVAVHHAPRPVEQATNRPAPQPAVVATVNQPTPTPDTSRNAQKRASSTRLSTVRNKAKRPQNNQAFAEPVEVVTAFYPIPYAAPLQPYESRRIVRVSVPQPALAALGLPMSQEPTLQPVDADVLVGEDNLARAVWFVREQHGRPQPRLQTVSAR